MHLLKPFFFTLKVLLLLLSHSTLKPLVDANTRNLIGFNIQQVTLNTNNNSFAYESDDEDIINRTPLTIESEIIAEEFRYLMKFGVKTYGDHDVDTYAIPDTGSDLIWLQDRICNDGKDDENCYCDDDPKVNECREKPHTPIDCWVDDNCNKTLPKLGIKHRCTKKHKCEYSGIVYGDGSKNKGILGQADFWFTAIGESKTGFVNRKMTIGFSKKLGGDKDEYSKSLYQGIVGLGQGDLSLIKQFKKIKTSAFSYYLPQFRRKDEKPIKARSKFKFGDDVKISDKNTSLLPKNDDVCDIRYCVQLEGIFLKFEDENNHEIKTNTDHKVMIIDSGTTKTYLTSDIFGEFIKKIKEKLNGDQPTKFENYYDNCFEKNEENKKNLEKLKKISFEFSGTKIELKRENFLDDDVTPPIKSNGEQNKYICLTVEGENKKYQKRLRNYGKSKSSLKEYHILGSRAQMDFLVAFNLTEGNKIVSFDHLEVEDNKNIEESLVLSE